MIDYLSIRNIYVIRLIIYIKTKYYLFSYELIILTYVMPYERINIKINI